MGQISIYIQSNIHELGWEIPSLEEGKAQELFENSYSKLQTARSLISILLFSMFLIENLLSQLNVLETPSSLGTTLFPSHQASK